ncbi:MAG: hypothetical protein II627_07485, partial [Lachnospiraceae bacterium]|nr:hypothetical protein [Lachnospiraceae bacterium]
MEPSTIVLLTMLAALILFVIPQIPLLFTCIAVSCFMYFSGIATAQEALSGFNSVATWAIIGMGMMSAAFFSTGLANVVGAKLFSLTKGDQKKTTIMLMLVG